MNVLGAIARSQDPSPC